MEMEVVVTVMNHCTNGGFLNFQCIREEKKTLRSTEITLFFSKSFSFPIDYKL